MRMQVRFLVEALVTPFETAEEGLLTGVDSEVRLKVEIEREFLAAELALVRFLTLISSFSKSYKIINLRDLPYGRACAS